MNGLGMGLGGIGLANSKEQQVQTLVNIAKENGIDITAELYEVILKRIYGSYEDFAEAILEVMKSYKSILRNKEVESQETEAIK